MTKLLSANFLRLWKSNLFWGSMGVSFGMAVFMVLDTYRSAQQFGRATSSDSELFKYAVFIGILAAALIPLFLGTEYSDGAIRNKVATGCSRTDIYFANLITAFTACVLCSAAYIAGCVGLGVPLLGWPTQSPALLLTVLLGTLLQMAAFCSIFTFVAMNCSRRSVSVVICLLGVFLLLMLSLSIAGRLGAPEYISDYILTADGIDMTEPQPNPQYLRGTARAVYQFLYDLLPTAQGAEYSGLTFTDPVRLMAMSLVLSALFTGSGAALFRRKDLK